MLVLYLDDSGSQDTDGVFVMGGFIATERQWRVFTEQWGMALRDARIPEFHAKDFFTRQRPPFNTWSTEQHVHFSRRFTAIAARHTAAGVGRGVDVAAYRDIVTPESDLMLPRAWQQLDVSARGLLPVMFCTRVCLEWIVREWPARPTYEPITVVFDQGTQGRGAMLAYCEFLRAQTLWALPYAGFTENSKSGCYPLQAADLMAWLARKQLSRELQTPGQPVHKALERVVRAKRTSISAGRRFGLLRVISELRRWRELDRDTP